MSVRGWIRSVEGWSVALLGGLFVAIVGRHVYPVVEPLETVLSSVGLPLSVGIGLLVGGVWLQQRHDEHRVGTVALWTVGGAVVGVALHRWLGFATPLEATALGEPFGLALNVVGTMAAAGTLLGYYASGSRRYERQFESSEARFRAVTTNSPFAVVTIDEEGTIRYANEAVEELFGYAPSELVGAPLAKLLPDRFYGDDRSTLNRYLAEEAKGPDDGMELTAIDADGETFPVAVSFGEYGDDGDRLFTGIVRDITDRTEAVTRLEDHVSKVTRLHKLATVIARADTKETIFQRTADGAVDLFSADAACVAAIDGHRFVPKAGARERSSGSVESSERPPIRTWYAQMSYESRQTMRVDYLNTPRWRSEQRAEPTEGQTRLDVEADSGTVYRSLLTVPIYQYGVVQLFSTEPEAFTDSDEEVANMLATHVGTACGRVEAEATVRRERDRLEEFASVLSHDIRNPLTVAKGQLELAQTADDPTEYFDAIAGAHERIERLIDDVLALARQGEAVGETEPISLEAVAQQAWDSVATNGATLRMDALGEVRADRSRLLQVFENLYRNAVEHGSTNPDSQTRQDAVEHGSTTPRSEPREDAAEHGSTRSQTRQDAVEQDGSVTVTVGRTDGGFYVEDDGPGIPADQRELIFKSGHSTSEEGTGFGLPIVQRIVEAHGWDITVTEGEEGGARFEISGVESVER